MTALNPNQSPDVVAEFALRDLLEALIKAKGFHEGHYELTVGFTVAVGVFALEPGNQKPGVLTHFEGAALRKVPDPTPLSVNAAAVNPAPPKRPRATASAAKPKAKT